jgi:hypothetical protein
MFLSKAEQSCQLLEATSIFLSFDKKEEKQSQEAKNTALKVLKMCPIFIETLQKVYSPLALQNLEPNHTRDEESKQDPIYTVILQPRHSELVFKLLLQMLAASSKTSDGQNSFGTQQRMLTEEKVVFEFIEQLNDFYISEPEIHASYLDFLLSFLHYQGDPRAEVFVRRVLILIYNKVLTGKISCSLATKLAPKLYDRLQSLIDLRYDSHHCANIITQAKGQQTLFTTVGLFCILFSSFFINPVQFKARMTTFAN